MGRTFIRDETADGWCVGDFLIRIVFIDRSAPYLFCHGFNDPMAAAAAADRASLPSANQLIKYRVPPLRDCYHIVRRIFPAFRFPKKIVRFLRSLSNFSLPRHHSLNSRLFSNPPVFIRLLNRFESKLFVSYFSYHKPIVSVSEM